MCLTVCIGVMSVVEEAYEKSIDLLTHLQTEKGFVASLEDVANYKRIWSRDGIIAGLAGMLTGREDLKQTFLATLHTLARNQDHTGRIVSNVTLDEGTKSYGTTVGRVDATIWFVIGVCQYTLRTGEHFIFDELHEEIKKALFYLECLELNGRGLLYVPQGGDWADEYITHAYVLFDQVLYYTALRNYYLLTHDQRTDERADVLRELIAVNYFPQKKHVHHPRVYNKSLFEMSLETYSPPLPIAYFSAHNAFNHRVANFDNALLLVLDIIDEDMKTAITHTVFSRCMNDTLPILPAFSPVIDEQDPMWVFLKDNYLYEFKNKPYCFHNGGLWPLVHGFFLAGAADHDESVEYRLESFANTLKRDMYIFPEFYHGETYEPRGTTELGFSAAGYILAYKKIREQVNYLTL